MQTTPPLGRPTQPHGNLPVYPPKPTAPALVTHPHLLQLSPWTHPSKPFSICIWSGLREHKFAHINRPLPGSPVPTAEPDIQNPPRTSPCLTWSLHLSNLTQGTWWHSPDLNPNLTPGTTGCRHCSALSGALPVSLSICHIGYAHGRHYACSSPRIQLTQRWVLFLLRVIQVIWTNYPIKS